MKRRVGGRSCVLRGLVLTVHVRGDLVTVHPVGALLAQHRLHPTAVGPVGADVGPAQVTASGGDVHTDDGAQDARAGGSESPASIHLQVLGVTCCPPPHSPQLCGVQHSCSRPLRWFPPQDQVHVVGGQRDVGGSVDGC